MSLFIYFIYVLAFVQARTEIYCNKQGYGFTRKGHGNAVIGDDIW